MSSFTNVIYFDEFYLIVFTESSDNFFEKLWTPFKPFNVTAWICIIAALVYMAQSVRIIQRKIVTGCNVVPCDDATKTSRSTGTIIEKKDRRGILLRHFGHGEVFVSLKLFIYSDLH